MRARAALMLATLATVGVLGVTYPAAVPREPDMSLPGIGVSNDGLLYEAVVGRLHAGQAYYPALGTELRQRGYPTRSPFNWRTPLHLTALSMAPWALWRGVLTALLVAFYVSAVASTRRRSLLWAINLLLAGILVVEAAADAVYISEVWAGALIGVSAMALGMGRTALGVFLGLSALFVRELAAPYCVACVLLAASRRRWREVAGWSVGALAYLAYFGWHVTEVIAHGLPTDIAHPGGWLQFGGLPFMQATLLKMGWFSLVTDAASAVALVMLTAGVIDRQTPEHFRAASAAFGAFFLVAGFSFNDYWGYAAAPVWALTSAYGVIALRDAILIAFAGHDAGGSLRHNRQPMVGS